MSRAGMSKEVKKKKKIELDYMRLILIGFSIFFVCTFIKQQFSMNEYDVKIADLQNQIESAEQTVEEINELKGKVNTVEYIEQIARNQLGLIKPYEKIFIDVNK
ncbi:MAG: septum formation initiator family protein [Clostridia bacterium]|nr:septum formation initiator family protein [Clostridia bacterium]